MRWRWHSGRCASVVVGGCTTGLLLTNPAAAGVRPTEDVDAIVEVASLAGWHALRPLLA